MVRSSFSILFAIRESKARKSGKAPIEITITVNGERCTLSTGKQVPIDKWDKAKQQVKGKDEEAQSLNNYLKAIKAKLYQKEAELLDSRMLEIKDFLQDIESMLQEDSEDSMSTLLIKGEKNRISVEDFYKNHEVYPELLLNLKELTTFFQNQYEGLEILLEFEDGGIQLDTKVVANILRQLTINIMSAVEDYNISMILIEGKVTDDKILLTLNCMCDDGPVDTFKISYDIDRI